MAGTVALIAALAALTLVSYPVLHYRYASRGAPDIHNALELWSTHRAAIALDTGVRLTVNATRLRSSGSLVEVSWSGVGLPRFDDTVALYMADADPLLVAPIKYKWAALSRGYIMGGSGSASFRLINLRAPLRFAFVRNGIANPHIAAWSEEVAVGQPDEPTGGHISLTGHPGEVLVQWASGAGASTPAVRWGSDPAALASSAAGDSSAYSRADLCGAPANASGWNVAPATLHSALITGLQPGRQVYYQYGDLELNLWSDVAAFTVPPVGADPSATVRLLAVADLGTAEADGSNEASEMPGSVATTRRLADEAASGRWQMLAHHGDISYARGYASLWDAFFDQMAPVVTSMPYMTGIGNHERLWPGSGDRFVQQYDSGGECGVAYEARTRMPSPAADQPWFSFDFGPVHFLHFSTEHAFGPGSAQHAFIAADLAGVNRSATPWVVVAGHRPMYLDSTFYFGEAADQRVATELRAALELLLLEHGVDLVWAGHHHSYQLTCAVSGGVCVPPAADGSQRAPVHMVIGHAGAGLTPNIHFLRPAIFRTVQLKHGYVRVEANATHFYQQVVASEDGTTMDQLLLTKPADWAQRRAAAAASSARAAGRQHEGPRSLPPRWSLGGDGSGGADGAVAAEA